jgi:predicted PurR-regulated permease PerM
MRSPDPDTIGRRQLEQRTFVQRALVVLGLVALFIAGALLLWNAYEILLLAFVGMLIATFLNAPAGFLARHTKVPYGLALAITIVTLLAIGVAGAWRFGPPLAEQAMDLTEQLPNSVSRVLEAVQSAPGGAWLLERLEANVDLESDDIDLVGGVTSTASALANAGAKLVYALFIGVFLAIAPARYRDGVVRLLPPGKQDRGREVLNALGTTLRAWLLGQLVSMFLVGVVVTTGLWLIGIPLALLLGIIAGLSEFIPIVGPIVAFVPAALIALSQGTQALLWVVLLYVLLQQLEGNVIMPLVQRRAVHLPPALTITALFIGEATFGLLGMLVATPLLAVTLVLVKMLYLNEVLDQHVELPGGMEEG